MNMLHHFLELLKICQLRQQSEFHLLIYSFQSNVLYLVLEYWKIKAQIQ